MFNSEEKALCLNSEDLRQAREGKGFPRAGASVKVVSHKPDICPAISLFGIPCTSNPGKENSPGAEKNRPGNFMRKLAWACYQPAGNINSGSGKSRLGL